MSCCYRYDEPFLQDVPPRIGVDQEEDARIAYSYYQHRFPSPEIHSGYASLGGASAMRLWGSFCDGLARVEVKQRESLCYGVLAFESPLEPIRYRCSLAIIFIRLYSDARERSRNLRRNWYDSYMASPAGISASSSIKRLWRNSPVSITMPSFTIDAAAASVR